MILLYTLLAGALVTAIAEVLALATLPYSGLAGTLLSLGLALVAVGIWGLKDAVGLDRIGRAGIVLGFFGYAAFATTTLLAMNAGVEGDFAIALTPFYLMSILFMALGFALLAVHAWRRGGLMHTLPGLPVALGVTAALYFLRPALAGIAWLHPLATLAGVLALGWIALAALRRAG